MKAEQKFAVEVVAELDAWLIAKKAEYGTDALQIARLGVARNLIVSSLGFRGLGGFLSPISEEDKKEAFRSFFNYIKDKQIEIPEDLKNKILLISL